MNQPTTLYIRTLLHPVFPNPGPNPDPTFHVDPDSSFQINAQKPWKSAKIGSHSTHLARHLQTDADPDHLITLMRIRMPDPTFQFYADPDPLHLCHHSFRL